MTNTVTISITDYEHLIEKCKEFDSLKEQLAADPENITIYTDTEWYLGRRYFIMKPNEAMQGFKEGIEALQRRLATEKLQKEWLENRSFFQRLFNVKQN
jgi:hypothetical protein